MSSRIGIVGVGHLAGYLVEGLCRGGTRPALLLSPRNREISAGLASRFGVAVAADSQGVVDDSDVVWLCLPPQLAVEGARELRFRAGQVVVSMAAGVALAPLAEACTPAVTVRAMPMTAVALGASPIPLHPANDAAAATLAPLGTVHPLASEAEFETACVMAMHYGWVMGVTAEAAAWLESRGIAREQAFALAAGASHAAACIGQDRGPALPGEVRGITRPGTYTGLGWRHLCATGIDSAWREACQKVLDATRGSGG